jgi:hypothetical protein
MPQARGEIGAIHLARLNAITRRFVAQGTAGELARVGCGIGILIICNDQYERKFFHGRLIQRFVKGAGRSRPIADACRAHDVLHTFHAPREEHTIDDRDRRPQMTDHRDVTIARPSAMDIAIAPAHRAQRGAEVSARGIKQGFTESEAPRLVPNQWRKHIALAKRNGNGDAERLLSAANEDSAMDFPRAIKSSELLIQGASQQHPTKGTDIFLARDCGMVERNSALRVHYRRNI